MSRNYRTASSAVLLKGLALAFVLVIFSPAPSSVLPGNDVILSSPAQAFDWKSKGSKSFSKPRKSISSFKRKIQRKSRGAIKGFREKRRNVGRNIRSKSRGLTKSFSKTRKGIEKSKKRLSGFKSKFKEKRKKAGTSLRNRVRGVAKKVRSKGRSAAKSFREKSRRGILAGMPKGVPRRTAKSLGRDLRNKVRTVTRQYGAVAGAATANFLSKNRRNGARILNRSRHVMKTAAAYSRDPKTRRRVVTAVLVAAAVGYAAYRHQDDIKYAVASRALDNVKVPVNGRMVSVNNIWKAAILKKAPYLEGTDIAEDPAKIIAYGLVGTAGNDLAHNLEIVPDGKGGVTTVAQTIERSETSSGALAALQFQSTMEGAGMEAMRSGRLGHNGKLFATAYYDVSTRIESSTR